MISRFKVQDIFGQGRNWVYAREQAGDLELDFIDGHGIQFYTRESVMSLLERVRTEQSKAQGKPKA